MPIQEILPSDNLPSGRVKINESLTDLDTKKVDKETGKSLIDDISITRLANTSGANTGDQNITVKVDKVSGKSLILDTEITRLASITAIFTTALKTAYDTASSWVSTNGVNVLSHISSVANPHSVTKAQVNLGNVDNTSDANKPISNAAQIANKNLSFGESYIANYKNAVLNDLGKYFPNSGGYEIGKLKQANLLNNASLVMMPSAMKAGKLYSVKPQDRTGDFTVSRNSTATFVGEDGILKTALANEPRFDYSNGDAELLLEPQATNVITYPLSFANNYWTKSGASIQGDANTGVEKVTVLANRDFSSDTGFWLKGTNTTITGGEVVLNGAASFIYSSILTIGKTYLVSVKVNRWTSGAALRCGSTPSGGGVNYKEIDKSAGVTTTFYFTAETNTFSIGSSSFIVDGSIDNVSVKEVQGFSSPHVDYPTGAFKLVEDVGAGEHRINGITTSTTIGTSYAIKIYVKKDNRGFIRFVNNSLRGVYVNLTSGVIVSKSTQVLNENIVSVGGFYEISFSFLAETTLERVSVYLSDNGTTTTYTGDGTSGIYVFGAQLETGSISTSLILPTTEGSTSTRNADVVTVTPPIRTTSITTTVAGVDNTTAYTNGIYTIPTGRTQKIVMK